jgi:hypothetical protein
MSAMESGCRIESESYDSVLRRELEQLGRVLPADFRQGPAVQLKAVEPGADLLIVFIRIVDTEQHSVAAARAQRVGQGIFC